MINAKMMNGNANVREVAPAIKGGISLTLSSCQIHHCQGWLPASPVSHQQHRGSSGVKDEEVVKAMRKRNAREEESICMPVRIQVWLSAYVHAHDWNHKLLRWIDIIWGHWLLKLFSFCGTTRKDEEQSILIRVQLCRKEMSKSPTVVTRGSIYGHARGTKQCSEQVSAC